MLCSHLTNQSHSLSWDPQVTHMLPCKRLARVRKAVAYQYRWSHPSRDCELCFMAHCLPCWIFDTLQTLNFEGDMIFKENYFSHCAGSATLHGRRHGQSLMQSTKSVKYILFNDSLLSIDCYSIDHLLPANWQYTMTQMYSYLSTCLGSGAWSYYGPIY